MPGREELLLRDQSVDVETGWVLGCCWYLSDGEAGCYGLTLAYLDRCESHGILSPEWWYADDRAVSYWLADRRRPRWMECHTLGIGAGLSVACLDADVWEAVNDRDVSHASRN